MTSRMSVAAALLLALAAAPAFAEQGYTVNIPFAFEAGETRMPAGLYDVKFPSANVVLIQCENRSCGTFLMTQGVHSRQGVSHAKLVFNRYGDRYFLNQAWSQGYDQGRQVRQPKAERELARSLAGKQGREVATVLPSRR